MQLAVANAHGDGVGKIRFHVSCNRGNYIPRFFVFQSQLLEAQICVFIQKKRDRLVLIKTTINATFCVWRESY